MRDKMSAIEFSNERSSENEMDWIRKTNAILSSKLSHHQSLGRDETRNTLRQNNKHAREKKNTKECVVVLSRSYAKRVLFAAYSKRCSCVDFFLSLAKNSHLLPSSKNVDFPRSSLHATMVHHTLDSRSTPYPSSSKPSQNLTFFLTLSFLFLFSRQLCDRAYRPPFQLFRFPRNVSLEVPILLLRPVRMKDSVVGSVAIFLFFLSFKLWRDCVG